LVEIVFLVGLGAVLRSPESSSTADATSSVAAPEDPAVGRRQAYVDSLNMQVATTGTDAMHFALADAMSNVLEIEGHPLGSDNARELFRGYLRKGFALDTVRMREPSLPI
jgi:hypothetical protein